MFSEPNLKGVEQSIAIKECDYLVMGKIFENFSKEA